MTIIRAFGVELEHLPEYCHWANTYRAGPVEGWTVLVWCTREKWHASASLASDMEFTTESGAASPEEAVEALRTLLANHAASINKLLGRKEKP